MILDCLRLVHRANFPADRRFGSDIELLLVLGAVVGAKAEGVRATAAGTSAYLDLPRETTRRRLMELVELGLLTRSNGHYVPTRQVVATHVDIVTQAIKRVAEDL
jgi:DNA-binding IclR family transcriptional regulator